QLSRRPGFPGVGEALAGAERFADDDRQPAFRKVPCVAALPSSIRSSGPQSMTRSGPRRGEKGYLWETVREPGWRPTRMLPAPSGTGYPAPGDAVGSRLATVAEVELGEDVLHVNLDRV